MNDDDLYYHYADETNYCRDCGEEMPGSWSGLICEHCAYCEEKEAEFMDIKITQLKKSAEVFEDNKHEK